MRNLLIFFACNLILIVPCFAQQTTDSTVKQSEIVGVWQVNSSIVGAGLDAYFQFYKSGKFIYNLNGHINLNPLYNISGVYKIENNILYLKIQQFKQLTEFKIVESNLGFQFGPFIINGGKL
ncbi:MAG TPA: hypothetical protein VK787_11140 [Puia sp.]|jgi:hypothetical protein|nr:hypothetical protein [Puia sp.]